MSFWQIVGANCLSILLNLIWILWMSGILLGRIPDLGRKHIVRCILAALLMELVLPFLGAVCYVTGFWRGKYYIGVYLWEYFVIFCTALFLRVLYQNSRRNCILASLMIKILCSYGDFVSGLYVYGDVYNMAVPEERKIYLQWMLLVNPACIFLCGILIHKSGAGRIYRQWMEQERIHKGIWALLGIFPALYFWIENVAMPKDQGTNEAYFLLLVALLLIIHLVFVYVGRDYQQKQYIVAQQASLRQQTVYIEKMEQMQAELRRFRHDFKNMMAGMYLQAREGDLDAVQSFIQGMTEDFDRQVGDQIRMLNQMANVQMIEVKGLLLEKLSVMQREEICCELEVMQPFEGTRMRSTDLLRCLGILIDNALEEVRGKQDARIHLMISSQKECITFRIRNPLYGEVDFQRLGTAGYSTKGEKRGTGLESYQRIVEKYDFVFSFTAIQDRFFVQELKICN